MSVRVGVLTPRVEAAPGALAAAQVSLHNDGAGDATVRIRVVGLDGAAGPGPSASDVVVSVPGGSSTTSLVPVYVPAGLGVGEHAAGIEVCSDRPGDRPSLVGFTLSVGSVERVELTAIPATVRGLRRAHLRVDVGNYEPVPVEIDLHGESPEAGVRFRRPHLRVLPGQHAVVGGKVKGPRRWAGEPTQHTLVITGQGRASSTSTTAVFVQRPLFARKLRGGLAALLVVALWLGAIGGFVWWWRERGDAQQANRTDAIQAIDTDGDGVPDLFRTADGEEITAFDTNGDGVLDLFVLADGQEIRGTDTDGDGDPDRFVDAAGNPVADPRGGAGGAAGEVAAGGGGSAGGGGPAGGPGGDAAKGPQTAVVRGTVSAAGSLDGITISLTPIALARAPGADDSAPQALTGSGPGRSLAAPSDTIPDLGANTAADDVVTKLWPARLGTPSADPPAGRRQSEPLKPMVTPLTTSPQADGVWLFTDVGLRQSYELVFAKAGFDTKSFVVTPPEDGSAVEMDVELEPATGSLSGRVTGPGGPLGGVAITVTDGTLTFSTTSATVGEVGTWSVEHVSTPGVYTVTGVRRGYGTEVRQVALEPGQQFTGADLSMRSGVGSISGRVHGPDGQPLGGVTVTASNEDDRHVTSTLTEGDIGLYHLPQVEVPGTYTLSVELPGYLTETRLVSVGGAVGGADFTLTRTTLQLTGTVRSSADGKGIPNAGLTLSTGDLTFKVATAGAPNQGSFAIEELPPGNYTVRVEHYQHDTSTQLVTLTAGLAPPPLDIALTPNGGIPGIGTGSLVVEVVDPAAETADRREIKNATVRLVSTATGATVRELTQEAFDFELVDIAVGTYTIHVTAPRYNPAPPRRVSIGLSQTRVQVDMQRLGQASGRVVDSLDGTVLTGYFVSLYRQPESPGDDAVFTLPSRADGSWQTPPDSLIPGTYRLEISDNASPAGYLVRDDQLLDPDVVGPTPQSRFMRFVLPEDALDPVVVADIEADRYPVLSGRVYRPALNAASTTAGTALVPVDAPSLKVVLDCADASGPYTADLLDVAGTVGADRWDSFSIDPVQVDANNLTGDCAVSVTADGLTPGTATLSKVDANDGNSLSDARIHIALTPPAPKVGGSVFWRNGSQRVPLADVDVSAAVLTAFPARRAGAESAPPEPTSTNLVTTSAADGRWDLDGQVYGVSDYTFDAAGFDRGVVTVTVDDTGAAAAAAANVAVTETPAGRFDVELVAAHPRDLTGTLTVHTTATFDPAALELTARSPSGATVVEGTTPCVADGPTHIIRNAPTSAVPPVINFTICNAGPGNWSVNLQLPDHFEYFGTTPPVGQFVDPVAGAPGPFELAAQQLGRVTLTIRDTDGNTPVGSPTITLREGTTAVPITASHAPGTDVYVLDDIPVDALDPTGTPRNYTLHVSLTGYDAPNAEIDGAAFPGGATAFPLEMVAGRSVSHSVALPAYGSRGGAVFGRVTYDPDDADHLTRLPFAELNVTAEPVDIDGNPLPVTADRPAPTVAADGDGFRVSGPPGYYRIVVSHDLYERAVGLLPAGNVPGDTVGTSTVVGLFLLENGEHPPADEWELDIRTGVLVLSVVGQLDIGDPVDGAEYRLFFGADDVTALVGTDDPLVDGHAEIDGLIPGSYRLEVRKYDGAQQIAFPAITTIVIGYSTLEYTSTVTVRAPLPAAAPGITGVISAANSVPEAVALPADAALYEVTITYPVPQIEVTSEGTTTRATTPLADLLDDDCTLGVDGGGAPQATCTADIDTTRAATGVVEYSFQGVPVGVHPLTFDLGAVIDLGYHAPLLPPTQATVSSPATNVGPTYALTVSDVQVNVKVAADGDLVDIGVAGPTSAPTDVRLDGVAATYTLDDTTLTFAALPPRSAPYLLSVVAALHAGLTDAPILVPVVPGASPSVTFTAPMTPTLARVEGTVGQCASETSCADLGTGGRAELISEEHATTAVAEVTGPVGAFTFDVPPGSYWLRVTQSGHSTEVVAVSTEPVPPGRLTEVARVNVLKLAQLTVTVANGATLSAPEIKLRVHGGATEFSPTGAVTGSPPQAAFEVPPGEYDVVVSATNYPTTVIDVLNPPLAVGDLASWSVNLSRHVRINVQGTGSDPVTVKLFGATDDVTTATPKATSTATAATPFDFVIAPTDAWFSQPLVAQVTAVGTPGYRTQVVPVPFALAQTLPTVTLAQNVQLSGSIDSTETAANESGAGLVRATSPGVADIPGDVVDGVYTLDGLTNNANGTARAWTITYDKPGVGSASTTVSVSASNAVTSPTLTPVKRVYDVTVSVTSGGTALSGATVTIGGAAAVENTETPGTYVRSGVPETFGLEWSVSKDGSAYTSASGTTALTGDLILPTVALTPRTVTMTVTSGGTAVTTGVTFTMCIPGSGQSCNSTTMPTVSGGTGGVYTFVAPAPAATSVTYRVTATVGSGGSAVGATGLFTVPTGAGVPSPAALTLALT